MTTKTVNNYNDKVNESIEVIYQPGNTDIGYMLASPFDILKKIPICELNGLHGIPISVPKNILDKNYYRDEKEYIPYNNSFYEFEPLPPIDISELPKTSPLPDTPTIMDFPFNEEKSKSLSIPNTHNSHNKNMTLAEQEYYEYIESIIEKNETCYSGGFPQNNKKLEHDLSNCSSGNSNKIVDASSVENLPQILPVNTNRNHDINSHNININNAQITYSSEEVKNKIKTQSKLLGNLMKNTNFDKITYDKFLKINTFMNHTKYYLLVETIKSKFSKNIKTMQNIIHQSDIKKKKLLSSKKGKKKFIEKCIKFDKEEFDKVFEILKHDLNETINEKNDEIKHDSEKMMNWFK
jgi:hypothetical protein